MFSPPSFLTYEILLLNLYNKLVGPIWGRRGAILGPKNSVNQEHSIVQAIAALDALH